MEVQVILLILLSSLSYIVIGQVVLDSPRIAIVGSGIGGSSCAYYLRKFLPNAELSIFEANDRIGK